MPETAYRETVEQEDIPYRMPLLRSEVNILRRDIDALKGDISELKRDVGYVKSEVSELKSNVRILQNDVSSLKSDVRDLRDDVSDLKSDVKTLNARLDGMDRRISDMHESQSKWFTLLGLLITIVPIAIAVIQHMVGK